MSDDDRAAEAGDRLTEADRHARLDQYDRIDAELDTFEAPRATLAADLVAALAELENPTKDATADAGSYSYAYATLAGVLEHARPVLGCHRLALLTPVESNGNTVVVRAVFLHAAGDTLEAGRLELARGSTAQQLGSAITYARRYLALAALGLAAEDDDGAAASTAAAHAGYVPEPSSEALADRARAKVTYERLKMLAGTDTAGSVKALAGQEGRKLTLTELGTYPAWRQQVDDLLAALTAEPPEAAS